MNTEEILNLFELIKNAPEENWEYNKRRLLEILSDYEKEKSESFLMNEKYTDALTVTENVTETLHLISNTNSLDEILIMPHIREKFKQRIFSQLQNV